MDRDRRGQLDALLDVELVLPRTEARGPDADTVADSGAGHAASQPPHAPLAPGGKLGKYRLEALLGAGGMGMVWQARDVELDRAVALKVIKPALAGSDVARSRLVREARAMARLHHANVITVFDASTVDGRDVIAMELIDGETLASWMSRARPRHAIIATLVAAGRGLAVAHAAKLIHRDFKPHNVLVDRRGRVVVTDFGLARAIGDSTPATEPSDPGDAVHPLGALDSALTITGAVLGTPAYMAPEQLAGEPADERADQFAFCATAWQALTGDRPFAGETAAELWAALACDRPRGADRVPRRLRSILERGLARDPAARWPSIDALLDAMTRAWRRPRRIAIAIAAAAGIAALAAFAHELRRVPWQPQIIDLPAFEDNGDGPAISPDGTQIAYVSDRERTGKFRVYLAALPAGESRAITPGDVSFQTPRWTRDGTALLLVHWDQASHRYRVVRQPLAGGPFTDLGTGHQADDCGDAIVIADYDRSVGAFSSLVLRHGDGTRQVLATTTNQWFTVPRCDRTGQRIVVTHGPSGQQEPVNDVFVIDRAGNQTALTRDHASVGGTFTPDGSSVVLSSLRAGKLELVEVPASGGEPHQLTSDDGPHVSPDISSDGRSVVFNVDATTVVINAGGGEVHRLTTKRQTLASMVPTPDGKHLLVERSAEPLDEILVIATSDGSERRLSYGRHPFPSLDGKRVLFGSPDRPPRLLSIALDGGPVTTIAELPGRMVFGADGPDGQEIEINRDGALEAWRVSRDGHLEPRRIAGLVVPAPTGGWRAVQTFDSGFHLRFVAPGDPLTAGTHEVNPDSERPSWLDDHRLAYATNGAFHIVDVTTGVELAKLPGPDAVSEGAALASDGVHWFQLQMIGHVTRHLLVNFADRPWR